MTKVGIKFCILLLCSFLWNGCSKTSEPVESNSPQVPQFVSSSIKDGSTVENNLENFTIRFSHPLQIIDKNKISLTSQKGETVAFNLIVSNVNLNVVLTDPLTSDQVYQFRIEPNAIAASSNKKATNDSEVRISFNTPKGEEVLNPSSFKIDESLVHPSPSKEAVSLYEYLKSIFGKQTLSGAMAKYTVQINEAEWMKEKTGKFPAIACFDLMNATREEFQSWGDPDYSVMVNNAKAWHQAGGVVSIMWHWRDPLRKNDAFYSMNTNNDVRTDFDVSKIHDTNSTEYKAMVEDINFIAAYLIELKDAGIPILWRPLHEAQGGWFWWGAKDAKDTKALWEMMYDRLVNHHQLNNLIWVWTVTQKDDATSWYPGVDLVDIVGADVYRDDAKHESYKDYFDFVKEVSQGRKMVALSECGAIPSVENMKENADYWLYFMPWVGDYTQSDDINGASFLKTLLQDDYVVTRDELSIW